MKYQKSTIVDELKAAIESEKEKLAQFIKEAEPARNLDEIMKKVDALHEEYVQAYEAMKKNNTKKTRAKYMEAAYDMNFAYDFKSIDSDYEKKRVERNIKRATENAEARIKAIKKMVNIIEKASDETISTAEMDKLGLYKVIKL